MKICCSLRLYFFDIRAIIISEFEWPILCHSFLRIKVLAAAEEESINHLASLVETHRGLKIRKGIMLCLWCSFASGCENSLTRALDALRKLQVMRQLIQS